MTYSLLSIKFVNCDQDLTHFKISLTNNRKQLSLKRTI